MSEIEVFDAEVVESRSLTDIETSIKGHMATFVRGTLEAVEARISAGHDLLEAKDHFAGDDTMFGRWASGSFGKSRPWRWMLMQAAANEQVIRDMALTQVNAGEDINFKKLVTAAGLPVATSGNGVTPPIQPLTGTYSTIVADPPWQYDNKATRGAAAGHYSTMSVDELERLEVPSADNAHLYLWVTNGFIREGFDLLGVWGFTYKTMLTWVKPQIGLGNYFRSATEHVLFGLKGSLPTEGKDVPNWFQADRKRHSAKPELFYDIVEKVSPGPYLELFARRRRFGWDVWGAEA